MNDDLKYLALWQAGGYVLVLLIVYLSVTSNPVDIGPTFDFKDKVYHVAAYFLLMAWFVQIYRDAFVRYVIAAMFILMGVLMEFVQSFDPARYYEFGDMLANTAGVIFGFWFSSCLGKGLFARIEKIIVK